MNSRYRKFRPSSSASPSVTLTGDEHLKAVGDTLAQTTLKVAAQSLYSRGRLIRAAAEAAPMDARLSGVWEAFVARHDKAAAASIARDQGAGLVGSIDAPMVDQALNRKNISFTVSHFGQRPRTQLRRVLPTTR